MRKSFLQSVLILVRDVESSSTFLRRGLGLEARRLSETETALAAGQDCEIILKQVEAGSESPLSYGYSPFLNFTVPDLTASVYTLVELGGRLDGAINYAAHGKTAALRAPDGFMLGLFEEDADFKRQLALEPPHKPKQ